MGNGNWCESINWCLEACLLKLEGQNTMKTFSVCIAILLLFVNCQNQLADKSKSLDPINFSTERASYAKSDSINLTLKNDSDGYITIGLRCGRYLEMSYQKKEDDQWSDNLWFGYMSLGCPTMLDTIQASDTFTELLPARRFDTSGTFRLLVTVYKSPLDSSETIISNSFKVD